MKKNVISFFAGVGGIDIGFAEAGDFETVYAILLKLTLVKKF